MPLVCCAVKVKFPLSGFLDWVAVGFSGSNLGDFIGSDFCVFWADWKDNVFLQVLRFFALYINIYF